MVKRNYLAESIEKIKTQQLFEGIRPIVYGILKEEKEKNKSKMSINKLVDKLMKNDEFREKAMNYLKDNSSEFDGWANNLNGKKYTVFDNMSKGEKRRQVTELLKDERLDLAPFAYTLWPDMSEDAARSWFYRKRDGKDGESFTDDEINTLYQELNK